MRIVLLWLLKFLAVSGHADALRSSQGMGSEALHIFGHDHLCAVRWPSAVG